MSTKKRSKSYTINALTPFHNRQMSLMECVGLMNAKKQKEKYAGKRIISTSRTFDIGDSDPESLASSQEDVEKRTLKYSFSQVAEIKRRGTPRPIEKPNTVRVHSSPVKPTQMMKVNKPTPEKFRTPASTENAALPTIRELEGSSSERAFSPVTPIGLRGAVDHNTPAVPIQSPCGSSASSKTINVLKETIIPSNTTSSLNITPPAGAVISGITLQFEMRGVHREIAAGEVVNSSSGLSSSVREDASCQAGPSGLCSSKAKRSLFTGESSSVGTENTRSDSVQNVAGSPDKLAIKKDFPPKRSVGRPRKITSPLKRVADASDASPTSPKKPKSEEKVNAPNFGLIDVLRNLLIQVYKSTHLKNLMAQEKNFFMKYTRLDQNTKYVVLKLFTFKRKWYGVSKFCRRLNLNLTDNEIIDLYHHLRENGFIETDCASEDINMTLNMLERSQLIEICKKLNANPKAKTKDVMVQTLLRMCDQQSTLTSTTMRDSVKREINRIMGYTMKIKDSVYNAFYNVYSLGTFLNKEIKTPMDYFYMALNIQANKIVLPEFAVEDYIVFETRDTFLSYMRAKRLKEEFDEVDPKKRFEILQICTISFRELNDIKSYYSERSNYENLHKDVPHLRRYTAEYVYISILSKSVPRVTTKYPEDAKRWLEFLIKNYPTSHRISAWYSQLAWLHMRYLKPTDYEKAATLLVELLETKSDQISERAQHDLIERTKALQRGKKAMSQWFSDKLIDLLPSPVNENDIHINIIDAQAMRENQASKKRDYVIIDEEGNRTYKNVEEIALDHYKENGYTNGLHCEGSAIKAIFNLLFWDIIYDPIKVVPATFLSSIQTAPLDMFTEHFYENRKTIINKRLLEITSAWSEERLLRFAKFMWDEHSHKNSIFGQVQNVLSTSLLETLLTCMSRTVLAKICERLVKNLGLYASGMPDLLVWNLDQRTIKFVEVKGEGDKLSVTQKLWLKYLQDIGADAEVCHVHSIGSKRKGLKGIKKTASNQSHIEENQENNSEEDE